MVRVGDGRSVSLPGVASASLTHRMRILSIIERGPNGVGPVLVGDPGPHCVSTRSIGRSFVSIRKVRFGSCSIPTE